MKKTKPASPDSYAHNALLGDLESIRTLLARDEAPPVDDDASDVPVLEDMVDGALTVEESTLTSRSSFDDAASGGGRSGLGEDTIKALLGDQWRGEADEILANARAEAEGVGTLSTSQLQDFNASLKARIDSILDDWLTEMMHSRIDDLRACLLEVLELELARFVRALTDKERHGK